MLLCYSSHPVCQPEVSNHCPLPCGLSFKPLPHPHSPELLSFERQPQPHMLSGTLPDVTSLFRDRGGTAVLQCMAVASNSLTSLLSSAFLSHMLQLGVFFKLHNGSSPFDFFLCPPLMNKLPLFTCRIDRPMKVFLQRQACPQPPCCSLCLPCKQHQHSLLIDCSSSLPTPR